jgi:hypothetical protein
MASKRHGAACGDVRLGCWQIAGTSGPGDQRQHGAASWRSRPRGRARAALRSRRCRARVFRILACLRSYFSNGRGGSSGATNRCLPCPGARAGPSAACLRSCCRWDTPPADWLRRRRIAILPHPPAAVGPVGLTWRGRGGRRPMRAAGVGRRFPCAATTGCPGPGQGGRAAGRSSRPGAARDRARPAPTSGSGSSWRCRWVERVSDVLAGQVLAAHDAGAGLLGDLPDQRLLDRFAVLDGAARQGPSPTVHGDHHHQAVGGEAQPECLGDQLRRWPPSG